MASLFLNQSDLASLFQSHSTTHIRLSATCCVLCYDSGKSTLADYRRSATARSKDLWCPQEACVSSNKQSGLIRVTTKETNLGDISVWQLWKSNVVGTAGCYNLGCPGSNLGGGEVLRTPPDRPWGPANLVTSLFPEDKAAGRGIDHRHPT